MMLKGLFNGLLTCTITFAAFTTAAYADVKIATVDVGRILNESPDALAKKKELDSLSQDTKKKIEARGKDLESLKNKLQSAKVADDSKEAEAYRTKATDYQRFVKDADDDLKRKYMKFNKEMTDKVLAKIDSYAKSKNLDLVLEKSDRYRGAVIFGAPSVDITDQILDDM